MTNQVTLDKDYAADLGCAPGDEVSLVCRVRVERCDGGGFAGEVLEVEAEDAEEAQKKEEDDDGGAADAAAGEGEGEGAGGKGAGGGAPGGRRGMPKAISIIIAGRGGK